MTVRYLNAAVSSEEWAKLRDWASVSVRGRLLLSGSIAHASLSKPLYASFALLVSGVTLGIS